MANPTFRGVALTTHGGKVVLGPPRDRSFEGAVIGVTGSYFQTNPQGARQIAVTGQYRHASGDGYLKAAIRTVQALIGSVGTFTDANGTSYLNCKLANFVGGPSDTGPAGSSCTVNAALVEAVP